MLSVWTRTEGPAKLKDQVFLDVVADGEVITSIDTALDLSVVMVNLTLPVVPKALSFQGACRRRCCSFRASFHLLRCSQHERTGPRAPTPSASPTSLGWSYGRQLART